MKPQATKEWVIQNLIEQELWKNDKVTKLSVVGVRGYYLNSKGRPKKNDRGIYDDAAFLISPHTFASFNFNTDPSSYRQGMATLVAPQQVIYKKGWHGYGKRSGHNAFRQASDVVVKRDGNKGRGKRINGNLFKDSAKGGRFWINLHRGGVNSTSSHGCQTVPRNQWDAFYSMVCAEMEKFKQQRFTYNLTTI